MMRPLAIIPAYNEADIIGPVVKHLLAEGCDAFVVDNWSNDGTMERAHEAAGTHFAEGHFHYCRWPADKPPDVYDWTGLLKFVEEIAMDWPGRWIMLNDADEIRRAPAQFPGANLAEAFELVSGQEYRPGRSAAWGNAVSFRVQTYVPVNNEWRPGGDPEEFFRYHLPESAHVDHNMAHVKAWVQPAERVDIHTHGGHQVLFDSRLVCSVPFLLKHYPVRSQMHGERKVLRERIPRYLPEERAKQWHVQYNWARSSRPQFLRNPDDLYLASRPTTIVTMTRFPEIFDRLALSCHRFEPLRRKIVVTSGGCQINPRWVVEDGWEVIEGQEPFVFGRNANAGIRAAGTDDVLLVNDDVQLLCPLIDDLAAGAAHLISPQVFGGINHVLGHAATDLVVPTKHTTIPIPFVCVLLRREVLDRIGLIDEGFTGYGGDDLEFCDRLARDGSLSMGFRSGCAVRHGFGDAQYSSSFLRIMNERQRHESMLEMNARREEMKK